MTGVKVETVDERGRRRWRNEDPERHGAVDRWCCGSPVQRRCLAYAKLTAQGRALVGPFLRAAPDASEVVCRRRQPRSVSASCSGGHPVPWRGAGGDSGRAVRRAGSIANELERAKASNVHSAISTRATWPSLAEITRCWSGEGCAQADFLTWMVWAFVHIPPPSPPVAELACGYAPVALVVFHRLQLKGRCLIPEPPQTPGAETR